MGYKKFLTLVILFFNSIVLAGDLDLVIFREYHHFIDSLDRAPIEFREMLIEKERIEKSLIPDSWNVRCVGRWPFGESFSITPSDRIDVDSLLFLGSGSGIRVLKLSNPWFPSMISKIDCLGPCMRVQKKGEYLYILSYALEIYYLRNPYQPERIGMLPMRSYHRDLAIKDSFLYIVGFDSLLRVVNCADPRNPYQMDSLEFSDYTWGVDVLGNYAYVANQLGGLRVVDISDPRNIREVASIGGWRALDVWSEGSYVYVAAGVAGLRVIDISNPLTPREIGYNTTALARRLYKKSFFVYVVRDSWNLSVFDIVDVSTPQEPTLISRVVTSGWGYDVCVLNPFSYAYTANDWEGLAVININDPVNPRVETTLFAACGSHDIVIDNDKAYIAEGMAGLKIVDVSNPSSPFELGSYDRVGEPPFMMTATARDSFAYVPMEGCRGESTLHSVDVSDLSNPRRAAMVTSFGSAKDMIIRGNLLYIANDNQFEIFNIANPRRPYLVGSCNSLERSLEVVIWGNYAYVYGSGWTIIDISNPANPIRINTFTQPRGGGLAIKDTFAYFVHSYDSLNIWSIANPYNPYQIVSVPIRTFPKDIEIKENIAYVGGRFGLQVFDISDPINPIEVGYYSTPDDIRRLFWKDEYIYAACYSGGVCILKFESSNMEESKRREGIKDFIISSNPVGKKFILISKKKFPNLVSLTIFNSMGQELKKFIFSNKNFNKGGEEYEINIDGLPKGVLLFQIKEKTKTKLVKVIKVKRR
ncbi:MAG: T9SS type A sorting domain-containing protein [candidate division WOR-3 bacterium]